MAHEIIELERTPFSREGQRLVAVKVLFYYPMEPIVVRGTPVPLSPRETLPAWVRDRLLLHPDTDEATARLAALDAGEAYFKVEEVEQGLIKHVSEDDPPVVTFTPEPLAAVLARVKARYPRGFSHINRQRARYAHTGESHSV